MSNQLSTSLKNRARYWAGEITKLARTFAPNHIKPYIHSKSEERSDGEYVIHTYVDINRNPKPNYGSLDAAAQEYGSGLHGKKASKYTIRPKIKKLLAFNWEVANANPERFTFAPDGRVTFHSVQHPGIQAANGGQGYVRPAANEIRTRMRDDIKRTGREAIKLTIRGAFKGK